MKTLILIASPRKAGDSAYMASLLEKHLTGEAEILHLADEKIAPCIDCRACQKQKGCALGDDFEPVAQKIQLADAVVVASPIWFGTLPGPFLSAMSRLQCFFSARIFRGEGASFWGKKGAVLLSGGGSGGKDAAFRTAEILLREMGAEGEILKVYAPDTDFRPAREDPSLEDQIQKIAKSLCE